MLRGKHGGPLTKAEKTMAENELILMRKMLCNLVTVCYGFAHDDANFRSLIVLELARYGSLTSILEDFTTFPSIPLSLFLAFLLDITSAVSFLHGKYVVHKDIKPHNFLVFEGFKLKICDFGLSKQSNQDNVVTASILGGGTKLYMAPECQLDGKTAF